MNLIPADILRAYMERFWGYGEPSARLWFVGMEHGGGTSAEEISWRLEAWHRRGQQSFEDLHEYHIAFGAPQWTGHRPRIQGTWRNLICLALAAEGKATSTDDVREYQATRLGRHGSATCLIELLPLPSRGLDSWRYAEWCDLPELRSRSSYEASICDARQRDLRGLIVTNRPDIVVFYGKEFRSRYEATVGARFTSFPDHFGEHEAAIARLGTTVCIFTRHPSNGAPKDLFLRVGAWIRGEGSKT